MSGGVAEDAAPAYRRLPGRAWGLLGRASLWQGGDHILHVQSRGYSEVYRRLYFREIQALVLRRTARSRNLAITLLLLFLLPLSAALSSSASAAVFWTVLAAPFAIAFLANLLAGPSCTVHIRTAIETTELAALCRVRPAQRALASIATLVEAAQGALTVSDIALLFARETTSAPRAEAPFRPVVAAPPPLPKAHRLTRHYALFLLMFVDALLSAGQVWRPGRLLDAGALALGVVELSLAIFALVEGRRLGVEPRLRRVTAVAMIYVCAAFLAGWASTLYSTFATISSGALRPGVVPEAAPLTWFALASIPMTLAIGTWGLYLLRRPRAASGDG